MQILSNAFASLTAVMGEAGGSWTAAAAFFGGMFFIGLVDRFIPIDKKERKNAMAGSDIPDDKIKKPNLLRMGLLTSLAVTIHNFPEGLVTFISTLKDPSLGVVIAIAIAIHNIPEGVAVSVPVYYATGNRKKAFLHSLYSGIAEPVGALVAYLVLMNFFSEIMFSIIFAFVGGIMVFIALDQLLPAAKEYSKGHIAIYG